MKIKLLVCWALLVVGKDLRAQGNPDVIIYVNTYKSLAMTEMQRSGIPASIILAQGIHETEAGTSELVRSSNNHFGIKCKDDWKGATVRHDDDSKAECFRSYPTPEDSYRDHSDFLKNSSRYASLFQLDPSDYEGWAYGLRKAGYATNIRYSQILIKLIKDYNLQQYSLIVMGRVKPSDEVVLTLPGGGDGVAAGGRSNVVAGVAGSNPGGAVGGNMTSSGNAAPDPGPLPDHTGDIQPETAYPAGEFMINKTRVVYVKAGVSMLAIADQYELPLARLLEFNDLRDQDVLEKGQLLFLQRKRKTGAVEFHIVRPGESLYNISQVEGVRYPDLLEMNQLIPGAQPAAGERIYLQSSAPARPMLTDGRMKN